MKEFDYVIIGGGCAGLSLAYELEIHEKLRDKSLAIIEPRDEYKRDKTWSFWKVISHNFDDCVKKNWKNFSINIPEKTNYLDCKNFPYQSIDSGLFYEKINNKLKTKTRTMALKPQSIRKNMRILANGELISKKDIIAMSELWTETQELTFKKFLKQGVFRFKVNNVTFQIDIEEPTRNSKGEKPGPTIKFPAAE